MNREEPEPTPDDPLTPGIKEELGVKTPASNSSHSIEGGKQCGHDGCKWETPEDMTQNFFKDRGKALMHHLEEEHNGKFPFEVEE